MLNGLSMCPNCAHLGVLDCGKPPKGVVRRGGEIGIRRGLKIPWEQSRAGSSPAPGTLIKR